MKPEMRLLITRLERVVAAAVPAKECISLVHALRLASVLYWLQPDQPR